MTHGPSPKIVYETWQEHGVWDKVFQALVKFYRRERRI